MFGGSYPWQSIIVSPFKERSQIELLSFEDVMLRTAITDRDFKMMISAREILNMHKNVHLVTYMRAISDCWMIVIDKKRLPVPIK